MTSKILQDADRLYKATRALHPFISAAQLQIIGDGCRGEEKAFFKAKLVEMGERVSTMPKTYEQDGKGDQAVVYLHYFHGGADWYITERDMEDEQLQAFGYADLGYGGELGYISIEELVANGVELDCYWTPRTLAEVKGS